MKKSLMFPFLFAALLSLCACTQGTEADPPTANAGITLTLRAAEHPELDLGMAGERHGLCFDPMREKPREGPCVFRVGSI